MTYAGERFPRRTRRRGGPGRRAPEMTAAAFSGAVAAVLGLGAVVVLVLLVWSTSPYPERGPDGALHVAAALWLLAHGVRLLRTDALTGAAAPIAVTPLLLSLPLAWLLYRTAGHAVLRQEERGFLGVVRPIGPVAVTCWFAAGYLAVAAAVVPWTGGGPLRAVPLSALLRLPPAACAVVVAGAWSACGRPSSVRLVARLPYGVRRTAARLRIPYGGLRVALRCAAGERRCWPAGARC
ncbi:hypothetical protein SCATT_36940 [Streptantibioticus cattleyicolor NRRL 8057 = DSM 46488]|uniref:Integral membrane protein n=1 Tax=Streptantibioticus cattleyicolor (strain ATCC 35852 / DSM 46488 / JCM 4925 / NBRC 14057 / NRRL 8057) TaxID=1003195 RepID=G8X074_STREN|nr:hypothetical protein SCATT_36940 [Streptantibioticus cattleyicolor NRRL 8057 = DSM 46488]